MVRPARFTPSPVGGKGTAVFGDRSQSSSARAGHAADALRRAERRGSKGRAPTLAVILRRLAVVLAAVVVCATVAGFWRQSTFLVAAAVDAAAGADANDRGERERVLGTDHDAAPPELAAAVFDDEQGEDDDLGPDGTDAVDFAGPPRAGPLDPGPTWPEDLLIETSRFAGGSALPRGPPARQA